MGLVDKHHLVWDTKFFGAEDFNFTTSLGGASIRRILDSGGPVSGAVVLRCPYNDRVFMRFNMQVPYSWYEECDKRGAQMKLRLHWHRDGTGTGTAKFNSWYTWVNVGQTIPTQRTAPSLTFTPTSTPTYTHTITELCTLDNTLNSTRKKVGSYIGFSIARETAANGDSYTGYLYIMGISVAFVKDAHGGITADNKWRDV